MEKLQNREVFRNNDYVFLILEYEKGFVVRVIGEDTEIELNSQADVNDYVRYYSIDVNDYVRYYGI